MKGGRSRTFEQLIMERDSINKLGKSMYFNRDIKKGEALRLEDVDMKSPYSHYAMPIKALRNSTPLKATRSYKAGDLVTFLGF